MDEAFVILDMADFHAGAWPDPNAGVHQLFARIPADKRPTVLQCSRTTAEQELLRLARAHPLGQFALFTATHIAVPVAVPTHVSITGETVLHDTVHRLAEINPAPSPF